MITTKQYIDQQKVLTLAHNDYEKGLNKHAFFKLHDRDVVEDLVQDTFMKTWKYLVRGGKIDLMKSFLYHVLNHLIVDEYRKHNKPASLESLIDDGFEPKIDDTERLLNVLDGKAALLLIHALPEKYRSVLRMRYTQNLSLSEMSLITGKSKNTMAVQIHRGLEKLKILYKRS